METKKFESLEELMDSFEVWFHVEDADPYEKEAQDYSDKNSEELLKQVKEDKEFWESVYEIINKVGEDESIGFTYSFSKDGFLILAYIDIFEGHRRLDISVVNEDWAKSSYEKLLRVFPPEDAIDDHAYSLELVSQKLGVKALESFEVVSDFDPTYEKDGLGMRIDKNILELIRYLNSIGIRTNGSCGGHKDQTNRTTYISFPSSELEKAVALALAWEKEGGLKYEILPLGGAYIQGIHLVPAKNVSLKEAQKDLDKMTDWLSKKIKLPAHKTSVFEIVARVRRKLGF